MPGARRLLARFARRDCSRDRLQRAVLHSSHASRLLGATAAQLGFDPKLIAYSYLAGRAKPDATLFDAPLAELERRGIDSQRVAYVGNDMRNDMTPARSKGCMTVLFAGDRRSLRLRGDTSELDALRARRRGTSLDAVAAICGLGLARDSAGRVRRMKRFGVLMVVLLLLGGVVFYVGWVQIHIPAGHYGVVFTRTNGWESAGRGSRGLRLALAPAHPHEPDALPHSSVDRPSQATSASKVRCPPARRSTRCSTTAASSATTYASRSSRA